MTSKFLLLSAALIASTLFTASPGFGQVPTESFGDTSGNTITGRAVQTVKAQPSIVRVYLQISAKGKTLEAALENLKKRCETIRSQVAKLGGKAETVKFTGLDKTDSSDRKQMLETLRRQMGSDRLPKGLATPQSVTVNATFSADWPLSGDTPEKLLLESDQLKKKLTDADLAGVKADEAEQTPEEREAAEEMQAMMRERYSGGDAAQKPGTPTLVFVARLPDAKHDAALAEGFKKAQANAERMAKAAGVSLGPLVRVNGMSDNFVGNLMNRSRFEYGQSYNGYPNQPWQPQIETEENEASSNTANEIEFHLGVEAVFSLNGKKP
jgi:uncharacterized protein YggE